MNAVLKYPGSKWRIAKEIASMIPHHHSYVEPYFGSGAVFFNKSPSAIETINDLDNDVPNLFRCIRENPDRLASMVAAIPYSRYEYESAYRILFNPVLDGVRVPHMWTYSGVEKRCTGKGEHVRITCVV